jgi:hypothetical protein
MLAFMRAFKSAITRDTAGFLAFIESLIDQGVDMLADVCSVR